MIEITEVCQPFLGLGCNRPFLGRDRSGRYWSVKAEAACNGIEHLFADYIGSRLAHWLGLPWVSPVLIGYLDSDASVQFEREYETEVGISNRCLLTGYHPNLSVLDYGNSNPFQYGCSNGPFMLVEKSIRLETVRSFLFPLLNAKNLSTIYGRTVFDNWLVERKPMMDMIQLDNSTGELVCLDASTCFHDRERTEQSQAIWSQQKAEVHYVDQGLTLYAKAVLQNPDGFEPWLARVAQFTSKDWNEATAELPENWKIQEYESLMRQTLDVEYFIQRFRDRVMSNFDKLPGYKGWQSRGDPVE